MTGRYGLSVIFLVLTPVVLFTGITAALNLSLPDLISSPLLNKISILPNLLTSNLLQGVKWLLFDVPLFSIEDASNAEVAWGLYWNLFNTILLFSLAFIFYRRLKLWSALSRRQQYGVVIAALLCWSVTFELWLIGCCGAGPQWWPEIVLLAKAYVSNPYVDTINWQGLYQGLTAISLPLRICVLLLGLILFWYSARKQLTTIHQ